MDDVSNKGKGWLLITSWRRAQWEGDDGQRETHYQDLAQARLAARQIGCVRGVSKVMVVRSGEITQTKDSWVCLWDKDVSNYWQEKPFVRELLDI
jgi:hypothetical protein